MNIPRTRNELAIDAFKRTLEDIREKHHPNALLPEDFGEEGLPFDIEPGHEYGDEEP